MVKNRFESVFIYEGKMFKGSKTEFHAANFFLLITFFIFTIHLTGFSIPISFAGTTDNDYLLDRALETIAMNRDDLSIRPDLSTNPFTLSLFSRWMKNPIKAPIEAQHRALNLFRTADRPSSWLRELAKYGDICSSIPVPLKSYTVYKLPASLPAQLKEAIHLILDAIYTANTRLTAVKSEVPAGKIKLFEKYILPDYCEKRNTENAAEGQNRIKELREAIDAAGNVGMRGIFEAGIIILDAIAMAETILRKTDKWHKNVSSFSFMTGLGPVKIGGPGPDVYENDEILIIDLGGNDFYKGKVASGIDGKCSIVLDLEGDDVYLGKDYTQASGIWGVGILFDLGGNDLYRAGNYSQGTGLFGIGLLMDGGGMDSYLGGKFVQAASSWGWGGLIDLAGEDSYQCHHSGQAYSEVLGISCLCDLSGNDKYISGTGAPDPREPDMNQSFSQGFASGVRNLAAGGFALLADRSGNDLYQCQYFGQGASYWMGVGILYDEDGKDTYIARRYAQGAGIHFSLGLLMDAGGNDQTISWGVSQGCGHDHGIGILINEAGNDSYASDWLSMGASEANGVGIFVDNSGDDGYETKTGMAVGHLIQKRRAGGIGLFIDAGGKDRYSRNGSDNSLWGSNRWGVGIDDAEQGASGMSIIPPGETSPISEEVEGQRIEEIIHLLHLLVKSEAMPYPENIEGMLSVASHWGLEVEAIQKRAKEKLLNLDPEKSVPAMVNLLNTPDIMSLIFMEKFFAVHAFHALRELMQKTEDHDPIVKSRAFYYIGRLKDSRALECSLEALNDPWWKIRSNAIRAVGEILDKRRLEILIPMKEALDEALRENDPHIIKDYLKDDEKIPMVLSVIARTIPLDYKTYIKYEKFPSNEEKERLLRGYVHFIHDHLAKMVSLLKRWIMDINESTAIAKRLMVFLNYSDPAVKKAAAYSLGQMKYWPAIPRLLSLINDPSLWVRDATLLSLALFGDDILDPLDLAMEQGTASFKILAFDALARIKSGRSKTIIEKYLGDIDQNVRRAAGKALFNSK